LLSITITVADGSRSTLHESGEAGTRSRNRTAKPAITITIAKLHGEAGDHEIARRSRRSRNRTAKLAITITIAITKSHGEAGDRDHDHLGLETTR